MAADEPEIVPITRLTVGEQVADSIRRLAWNGQISGGMRLNQEDLAARLGVSRIPVRDALMALEREGLVRMEPNRGAYLTPIDENATRDHYALYGLIYGFALRRAAERADCATIDAIVEIAGRASKTHDPAALQPIMQEFFQIAVRAGDSPRLRAAVKSLTGMVPGNFFAEVSGTPPATARAMRAIAAAMADRDGSAAADTCCAMLEGHGELVVKVMRDRGLYD